MLAYRIIMELKKYWHKLDLTVDEWIAELSTLYQIDVQINDQNGYTQIPQSSKLANQLLSLANIRLPEILPKAVNNVTTKLKLQNRRNVLW